ncbi:sugar kinase [Methyloraptor flagellatus]|uniref:Sugar kinase n=1 Tax=Methyloraptor flagellatus TaxID=3162530 RepID=A0AAU7X8T2_9HYPH
MGGHSAGLAFDIVAMGEPMYEFNQRKGAGPRDWLGGFGGDASNTAIAAARLGARVAFVTGLGDDAFGTAFRELWTAEGVDHSAVKTDPAAHTGVYFVTHGPEGHAFSYLRAGSAASRIAPADVPHELIRGARVLHASAISQAISASACDAVFSAIETARAAGVTVSYDTNLRLRLWPLDRARAIIEATAALSDILLPGLDDARLLTGLEAPDAIADHYLAKGVKIVALTMGKDGALIATPERREIVAPIKVAAVDATGAGDAFDGGFLVEWLASGDAFSAGRFANVAAGLSTEGYGAVDPLPRRAAVEARLAR